MKGPKQKWLSTGRLRRTVLLLGVAGATAGAALLTAASAQAVTHVGSEPGNLSFSPASGSATAAVGTVTWSTTDACPTGFNGSAQLEIIDSTGVGASASPVVTPASAPLHGSLLQTPAQSQALGTTIAFGQPVEWAVACFTSTTATGASEFVQSTDMTITSATGTYTTGPPPAAVNTTTTLGVSANPVTAGTSVTLTATVTSADALNPAGSVTFFNGTTALNTGGTAVVWTTTTPFTGTATFALTGGFTAAGTFPLTATFTPTNTTGYNSSTSATTQESVIASGSTNAGGGNPVPISVTVAATGTLTVSVAANTGVALAVNGLTATGTLPNVTVTDSRNNFPGWSVSGTESVFTGSGTAAGATISASQLGWAPAPVGALSNGATAGPLVSPGTTPGLAGSALLASAPHGQGAGVNSNVFNAALTLAIPALATAGPYSGSLTITYLQSN